MIPPYVKKQANTVAWRLDWMRRTYGVERLLAVHLTTVDPWDWARWYRQWNNLWKKRLVRHYAEYLLVPEFSPGGLLHAHAVLIAKADVRTGYDFEARERARKRGPKARWRTGANAGLRREMSRWSSGTWDDESRSWMGKGLQLPYGFGYTRVEPVKSPGGFARYMAKYMTKGFADRKSEDKGRRLIRCSKGAAAIQPPKVGVARWLWDQKLAAFLAVNKLPDFDALREKAGKRWAWDLKEVIWATPLRSYRTVRWTDLGERQVLVPAVRVAERDGHSFGPEPSDRPADAVSEINFDGTGSVILKHSQLREWAYLREVPSDWDAFRNADGTMRAPARLPELWSGGAEVDVTRIMGNGPGDLWRGDPVSIGRRCEERRGSRPAVRDQGSQTLLELSGPQAVSSTAL